MSSKQRFSALITDKGDLIKLTKSDEREQDEQSKKLAQDIFGQWYKSGRCSMPPYNPYELIELLEVSTYHYKCIKQKALDVAGDFSVVETEEEKDSKGSEKDKKKKKVNEANRDKIIDFTTNCNNILSFNQIVKALAMDFETIGWFVLEVIRNRKGEITGLNHIPAHTCRFLLDGTGIMHKRDNRERVFKFFGDTEARIDPNTGDLCNEVIYRFDYTPKADFYGIPDYIPAVGSMLANLEIRDYNIKFFENGAVPQYAVILEGGEMDDETEDVIKAHFRDNIKGSSNAHKTLVISSPEGGKVNFEPLAVDVKDGHFRLYRMDNRDEIIHAHGVPPYRIGIAETGALGGNVAEEMTAIYKNSIVKPRQSMMEDVFKKIFADKGFNGGITDWKIQFDEIDIDDEKLQAEIKEIQVRTAKTAKEAGTFTPDEIRVMAGETPLEEDEEADEEMLEWAKTPIDYASQQQNDSEDPQEGEEGQEGNLSQGQPQGNSKGSQGYSESAKTEELENLLNDYRDGVTKGIVEKIKKVFQVRSERVWENVKKERGL